MLEPQIIGTQSETDGISFFNRDHIILVTIHHVRGQTDSPWRGEIVVTTTAGTRITILASSATLAKFVDDLANHVESNFVSIATTPSPPAVAVTS